MSDNEKKPATSVEVANSIDTDPTTREAIDAQAILDAVKTIRDTVDGRTTTFTAETTTNYDTDTVLGSERLPATVDLTDATHPNDVDRTKLTFRATIGDNAMKAPVENSTIDLPFIPLHGVKQDKTLRLSQDIPHSGNPITTEKPYYNPDEQAQELGVSIVDGVVAEVTVTTIHGDKRSHNIEQTLELERTDPDNLNVQDAVRDVRSVLGTLGEWSRQQQAQILATEQRKQTTSELVERDRAVQAARELVDSSN